MAMDTRTEASTQISNGNGKGGPSAIHFGRLVAARRSALGLSQEELATRMDTTDAVVAGLEDVQEAPSARELRRLTNALGILGVPGDWDPRARQGSSRDGARPGKSGGAGRRAAAGLAVAVVVVVGVAAAIMAANWLSPIVMDGDGGMTRVGLVVAIVAASWLTMVVSLRGARSRVPAAILVSLWLTVVGVGLISRSDGPGLSAVGDLGIDPALALPGAEALGGAGGGVLGVPTAGEQSPEHAGGVPVAAGLAVDDQLKGCASLGRAGGRTKAFAIGIPSPWASGVVVHYPSSACGPLPANSLSHGVFAGAQDEETSLHSQGGSGSGENGGSPGGDERVAGNVNEPGSGAGDTVGEMVKNVGDAVKNPVSGAGNAVNDAANRATTPAALSGTW